MKEIEKENVDQQDSDEELGNYITQVVTDIGKSMSGDQIMKLSKIPNSTKFGLGGKKQRWKMASVGNPQGVPAEEYSKFAGHVYQYLNYVKELDVPTMDELKDNCKLVTLDRLKRNSKL